MEEVQQVDHHSPSALPKIAELQPLDVAPSDTRCKPSMAPKNLNDLKSMLAPAVISHEADQAVHKAIHDRVKLLPNKDKLKSDIGDCTTNDSPKTTPQHQAGLMWPTGPALEHPASEMLDDYLRHGCPVDWCGPDWNEEQLLAALEYGAHPSAKIPEALKCLIAEAETKVKNGFAKIVTWKEIKKKKIPKKVKVSPVAKIPHKSRAFRGIIDLSFYVRALFEKYKSVNETTNKLAKKEAMMDQLGLALQRMIAALADGQDEGHKFLFSKLDIKDGLWRMVVSEEDA